MRFPTRLLGPFAAFTLLLFAVFLVVVEGVVTAAIGIFADSVPHSVWERSAGVPRGYSLVVGLVLVREYLPMYLAHGQTRRRFCADAGVTVTLLAPFLAALVAGGYLVEAGVYALAGWPHALTPIGDGHLFQASTDLPLVFTEYALEYLVWMAAGAFIGAGFYRWSGGGIVTIPVAFALVALVDAATGSHWTDVLAGWPVSLVLDTFGDDLPRTASVALPFGLGAYLTGLALSWAIIRDMPLRNRAT